MHSVWSAARIKLLFIKTCQILTCSTIDEMAGCEIYFKCENFQKVGAFKSSVGQPDAVMNTRLMNRRKKVSQTHSSATCSCNLPERQLYGESLLYIVMPLKRSRNQKRKAVQRYGGEISSVNRILKHGKLTLEAVVEGAPARTFILLMTFMDVIRRQQLALRIHRSRWLGRSIMIAVGCRRIKLGGTALLTHQLGSRDRSDSSWADLVLMNAYRSFRLFEFIPQTDPKTIADGLWPFGCFEFWSWFRVNGFQIYFWRQNPQIIAAHVPWSMNGWRSSLSLPCAVRLRFTRQ